MRPFRKKISLGRTTTPRIHQPEWGSNSWERRGGGREGANFELIVVDERTKWKAPRRAPSVISDRLRTTTRGAPEMETFLSRGWESHSTIGSSQYVAENTYLWMDEADPPIKPRTKFEENKVFCLTNRPPRYSIRDVSRRDISRYSRIPFVIARR